MAVVTANHTFTATGNSDVISLPQGALYYGICSTATGAGLTSYTVVLEGTLDGTNYTTIKSTTQADGDGTMVFVTTPTPHVKVRLRCSAITLGTATNIVTRIVCIGV